MKEYEKDDEKNDVNEKDDEKNDVNEKDDEIKEYSTNIENEIGNKNFFENQLNKEITTFQTIDEMKNIWEEYDDSLLKNSQDNNVYDENKSKVAKNVSNNVKIIIDKDKNNNKEKEMIDDDGNQIIVRDDDDGNQIIVRDDEKLKIIPNISMNSIKIPNIKSDVKLPTIEYSFDLIVKILKYNLILMNNTRRKQENNVREIEKLIVEKQKEKEEEERVYSEKRKQIEKKRQEKEKKKKVKRQVEKEEKKRLEEKDLNLYNADKFSEEIENFNKLERFKERLNQFEQNIEESLVRKKKLKQLEEELKLIEKERKEQNKLERQYIEKRKSNIEKLNFTKKQIEYRNPEKDIIVNQSIVFKKVDREEYEKNKNQEIKELFEKMEQLKMEQENQTEEIKENQTEEQENQIEEIKENQTKENQTKETKQKLSIYQKKNQPLKQSLKRKRNIATEGSNKISKEIQIHIDMKNKMIKQLENTTKQFHLLIQYLNLLYLYTKNVKKMKQQINEEQEKQSLQNIAQSLSLPQLPIEQYVIQNENVLKSTWQSFIDLIRNQFNKYY